MTNSTSPDAGAAATPDGAALEAAREAFGRHAWLEAYDLFERALAEAPDRLSGRDLETFAQSAFFAAKADARLALKERAFKAYQAESDPVRAAYVAVDLASDLRMRGKQSLGSAWVQRAERLLDGLPETYAHGWLALIRGDLARNAGDTDASQALAEEAIAIASRTGDADLRAVALANLAMIKIALGAPAEGFRLLEEAAIDAVNGELSPIIAGITSCQMISACRDLTDYQRASEWLEATDQWCEQQEVSGFPGVCRVHRAEIVALKGGWDRAVAELQVATSELKGFDAIPPMADGLYAIGEIRRLQGDMAGAEDALRQAHALGRSPQPALALIRLGMGKVKSAASAIEAALADTAGDQWARVRLLGAQVEIAIAAGEVGRARTAAEELARLVDAYPSPALEAGRRQAFGRVALAEGDPIMAASELRAAVRSWREVGSPYEVARARAVLAGALRAVGDDDGADLELEAARDTFAQLGAGPDLAAVEAEQRDVAARRGQRVQVRMTFMFTDIVGSTSLAEALGDDAWERLLGWHDDTLRALIDRHEGRVVQTTGDGFFASFDEAARGVSCAVAIQQALRDHRQGSGFAPPVRIGLHTADATQRGHDFSGIGVHVAARVAAAAGGDEIVVTEEVLDAAPGVEASAPREVTVRGVAAPLRVASVRWSQARP